MECKDCGSDNIHTLVWVDKDNKYVGESIQSENGEYWCEKCKERKGVPYFEVTDSGMAIYYCEPCGKELTENNNA